MHLAVNNLGCQRGGNFLFKKLNFTVAAGQLLYIKGPNGVGKSSLLRILAGLSQPEKGRVLWKGINIGDLRATYKEERYFLGHKNGLRSGLTAEENLHNQLFLAGSYRDAPLSSILTDLQLIPFLKQPCHKLSAGQQRKIALAAMLAAKKSCWILDEPLTFLDSNAQQVMQHYFNEHLKKEGIIIMSTHEETGAISSNHFELSLTSEQC